MVALSSSTFLDTTAAGFGACLDTGFGATVGFGATTGLDATLFPGYSIDYVKGTKVILFTKAHVSKGTQFTNYRVQVA